MRWRWIFSLFMTALTVGAIQRPDAKETLRGLAKLPKIEVRVTLDFDSARGFSVLLAAKDASLTATELRTKLNETPDDARLILELAEARIDSGDVVGARRDLQRAAETLRKRLDAQPGNSRARLELASALHGLGQASEAEPIYRELVKAAPRSGTNWMALSQFLEARAWEIAGGTSNWKGRRSNLELCQAALRTDGSTEALDRAERYFEESLAAAREAVSIDGDSGAAHYRLAIATANAECFSAVRARVRSGDAMKPGMELLIFSAKALPGLDKAAEIESENPARLATALLWRGLSEAREMQMTVAELGRRPIWDALSDAGRQRIQAGLERLGGFSESASAGAAWQARGLLRFLFRNDLHGAADDLRAAAAEIPESEQLWEILCTVLSRSHDYHELAAVSEARALVRPSARNHLLVAKAYERLSNLDRAEDEIGEALAMNNADFSANLALANVLMRKSKKDDVSPRARTALVNAERAIRGSANGQQLVDLALAQSIYHGLTDNFERAREILKAALAYAKNNPDVTAALSAIGY